MRSRLISRPTGAARGGRALFGVRGSILGVMLALIAGMAIAPLAMAAPLGAAPTTRIEVVVDGFQNESTQTFAALTLEGGIANSAGGSGGGGAGRASLEDLVITKAIDGASPLLLESARTGLRLRSVTVRVFERAPHSQGETLVLEVTATDVGVSLDHVASWTATDDPGSNEKVVFRATTATFSYPVAGRTVTFGPEQQ